MRSLFVAIVSGRFRAERSIHVLALTVVEAPLGAFSFVTAAEDDGAHLEKESRMHRAWAL